VQPFPSKAPPTVLPIVINDNAERDKQELERLRRQTAALRARIAEFASPARTLAASPSSNITGTPIGETLRFGETHDVGQATPAALLQTWDWASDHGDTNRLAQLIECDPETDMWLVQRMFERKKKDAEKGIEALLAEETTSAIRLVEERPAGNDDRWIVEEWMKKDGSVSSRTRIRVRPTGVGWKIVIGIDGQCVEETIEE
jgi:hypothetical protein